MKSVGIITMHNIRNYGSFMQAYATLHCIENLGLKAELIDYRYPNSLHHCTSPSLKSKVKHGIGCFAKLLLPGNPYQILNKRWNDAFSRYYKLSRIYPTRDSLFSAPPTYDIYLIGSDQVWNESFINYDDSFFAAFAPEYAKKVAF